VVIRAVRGEVRSSPGQAIHAVRGVPSIAVAWWRRHRPVPLVIEDSLGETGVEGLGHRQVHILLLASDSTVEESSRGRFYPIDVAGQLALWRNA